MKKDFSFKKDIFVVRPYKNSSYRTFLFDEKVQMLDVVYLNEVPVQKINYPHIIPKYVLEIGVPSELYSNVAFYETDISKNDIFFLCIDHFTATLKEEISFIEACKLVNKFVMEEVEKRKDSKLDVITRRDKISIEDFLKEYAKNLFGISERENIGV